MTGVSTNVPRGTSEASDTSRLSFLSNKDKNSGKSEKVWIVVFVVCFGAIGGILFGMDQANFGGVETKVSFVEDFCSNETRSSGMWGTTDQCMGKNSTVPIQMSDFQGWGSGLIPLGAAVGALFLAPYITRSLGRRAGLASGCLVVIAAMIWSVATTNIAQFYASRLGTGIGVGMVTFTLPMWTAELAPKNIRGSLGCTLQMACVIGSLIATGVNIPEGVTWQHSLLAPVIPAAIVMLFIFLFPESPRFVLKKYGAEKARSVLAKLRGTDDVLEELNEIENSLLVEKQEAPWSVLFTDPSIRRRVIIANMLQWMQQLTGVNALLGHGPKLFEQAGVPLDGVTATFVTAVFNFLGTIVMIAVIDKYGRRALLLCGAVGMFIFMAVSAVIAKFAMDSTAGGYMLLASVCLYFLGFAIAWGGIPWVYPSEIFPMDIKEKALSTSVFSQWIANFVIAKVTPYQIDHWGAAMTFAFYSMFIIFNFAFVYYMIPETKGVAIEEMDKLFGERKYLTKDKMVKVTSYNEITTPSTKPIEV